MSVWRYADPATYGFFDTYDGDSDPGEPGTWPAGTPLLVTFHERPGRLPRRGTYPAYMERWFMHPVNETLDIELTEDPLGAVDRTGATKEQREAADDWLRAGVTHVVAGTWQAEALELSGYTLTPVPGYPDEYPEEYPDE